MFSIAATAARQRAHFIALPSHVLVQDIHILVNPRTQNKKEEKPKKESKGRASYRFVDRTRVRVVGGDGGKGNMSMVRIGRKHHRRPDGGHGGRGGNVIIVADPEEQSLKWTSPHMRAEFGAHGSSQEMHGRSGNNLILRVPCGVIVRRILNHDDVWDPVHKMVHKVEQESEGDDMNEVVDEQGVEYVFEMDLEDESEHVENDDSFDMDTTDFVGLVAEGEQDEDQEDEEDRGSRNALNLVAEEKSVSTDDAVAGDDMISSSIEFLPVEERQSIVLADLDKPGAYVVVARGGRGGKGNCTYARKHGPIPDPVHLLKRGKGKEGEISFLELELKLIADLGLVGFPNAGKSSLLAAMSRAMPEIAPYPFTTLHPLVGCIEYRDGFRVMAADVPGLIGGASEGRGRGHDFLRHLERTKALLYIVDAAGVDGRDPMQDLLTLTDELSAYGDGDMLTRPALVVANKVDLLDAEESKAILFELGAVAKDAGIRFSGDVMGISAGVTGVGLEPLSRAIRTVVLESENERSFGDEFAESFY
jgi:GTP-binding protein